ncbi:putative metal-binding motif-containing protein [Kangiella sp. M94]
MNKALISLLSTLGIVSFWLLASFLFVSMPAHANAESDAKKFCAAYEEKSGYGCQVERCRCGKGETELQRWNRKMRFDICACVNTKAYNLYLEKEAAERNRNRCNTNADCSDGIFCNGEEVCRTDGRYRVMSPAGNGTCVPGEPPCESGLCFEREKSCKKPCEDKDGDGYKAMHCGGDDCDDNNPNRNPGNKEICDSQGIDEDCNPRTVGDLDADGDGYVSMQCR